MTEREKALGGRFGIVKVTDPTPLCVGNAKRAAAEAERIARMRAAQPVTRRRGSDWRLPR